MGGIGGGVGIGGCGRGGTGNGTGGFTIPPIGPDGPVGIDGADGLGDTPITPLTGGVGGIGFGSTLIPGKFGGGWLAPLFDNSLTRSSMVDSLFWSSI